MNALAESQRSTRAYTAQPVDEALLTFRSDVLRMHEWIRINGCQQSCDAFVGTVRVITAGTLAGVFLDRIRPRRST